MGVKGLSSTFFTHLPHQQKWLLHSHLYLPETLHLVMKQVYPISRTSSLALLWEFQKLETLKKTKYSIDQSSKKIDNLNTFVMLKCSLFCILKITPIFVFAMIQGIISLRAFAPTYFTIFIQGLSLLLFSFINNKSKLNFLSVKGYCVYMINKIIHGCW